ncbi:MULTISPECIES: TraR/DksA family transcriptional regulator [Leifsonia]|jgi:RNA polymerase-binding transcription factor DksA|uniref:RNA polymerase-binding transcription factor DksA n=3 Tax=Leifsonia TaxID=110932 RepID=A0A7W4YIJ4_LEIAQ|nr:MULTISPECIES: TraR/DksA family transcriptional regulator [Leifsonia]ERK71445.1 putative RNA polymerase-binding protein DksA [Leifsonia aquatica ATCC 14665]MBB2967101.1 RNA polymerase-binding transcription factor DksA [Leifsonia aquatica]NYK11132.1 RNA polymerase-binding transcription factor DksA [Leifsonia naganoensis]
MHTTDTGTLDLYGVSGLSEDELEEFAAVLDRRRHDDIAEGEHIAETLGSLLASRSESTADDEHDPEGPTLSSEWSRLQALRSDTARDLAAVDAAGERLRLGTFGICAHCGRPIGVDRLRARPTAEFCIHCAIASER